MNYCTPTEVLTYNQDQEMDVEALNILIPAVSKAIDLYCRRSFGTITEGRVYHYERSNLIPLRDDLVSLTSVVTNAPQTITADKFNLEPISGPPYRRIECLPGTSLQWATTTKRAITINGIWGYQAEVPDEIVTACLIWVSVLYAQSTVHGIAEVSGGDINANLRAMTQEPPAETIPLLDAHRKIRIASVG